MEDQLKDIRKCRAEEEGVLSQGLLLFMHRSVCKLSRADFFALWCNAYASVLSFFPWP